MIWIHCSAGTADLIITVFKEQHLLLCCCYVIPLKKGGLVDLVIFGQIQLFKLTDVRQRMYDITFENRKSLMIIIALFQPVSVNLDPKRYEIKKCTILNAQ